MHVDIGAGPANLEDGLIAYDRSADGSWSRNGAVAMPPAHLRTFRLPSGATFEFTYSLVDSHVGWFVYDCLSCHPHDAAAQVSRNYIPFLQAIVKDELSDKYLSKAKIAIFLGARLTMWDFPELVKIPIVKQRGEWRAPAAIPQAARAAYRDIRAS